MPRAERIRIAVLLETRRFDGPIRNLMYALDELKELVSPVFVMIVRGTDIPGALLDAMQTRGIEIVVIPERFRFDPRAALLLVRALEKLEPDVIQVHNTKSRLFVSVAMYCSKVVKLHRTVFFFHGETWTTTSQRLYNVLDRFLLRLAKLVVVVTPMQVGLLGGWGVSTKRIRVVRNVVPHAPPRSGAKVDRSLIMAAGRLSQEKGFAVLLDALSAVGEAQTGAARLVIYGEGPEEAALNERAVALGISDRVHFAGYSESLDSAYEQAGLFVLPSLSEGLPNVLLEAAARAVPIVATRVGGVPDLFEDGTHARLVLPGSALEIRNAIVDYLRDPDPFEAMALNARIRVREEYGPSLKAQQLLQIYREALE